MTIDSIFIIVLSSLCLGAFVGFQLGAAFTKRNYSYDLELLAEDIQTLTQNHIQLKKYYDQIVSEVLNNNKQRPTTH